MSARGIEGKARRRKHHITKLIDQSKRDAARIIELEAELERYGQWQYGLMFDCANEPGHEHHAHYADADQVFHLIRDTPPEPIRVNGHPTRVVRRLVGPWSNYDDGAEA